MKKFFLQKFKLIEPKSIIMKRKTSFLLLLCVIWIGLLSPFTPLLVRADEKPNALLLTFNQNGSITPSKSSDWYTINVLNNALTLTLMDTTADLDLYAYRWYQNNNSLVEIARSECLGTENEIITLYITEPTELFFEVRSNYNSTSSYSLKLSNYEIEENPRLPYFQWEVIGPYSSYYCTAKNIKNHLPLNISLRNFNYELDLYVWYANGTLIENSNTTGNGVIEVLMLTKDQIFDFSQKIIFEVRSRSPQLDVFLLNLTGPWIDDEPNNNITSAIALPSSSIGYGQISHIDDIDVFNCTLLNDTQYIWRLSAYSATLNMKFMFSNASILYEKNTIGLNEIFFIFNATSSETIYTEISGVNNSVSSYCLEFYALNTKYYNWGVKPGMILNYTETNYETSKISNIGFKVQDLYSNIHSDFASVSIYIDGSLKKSILMWASNFTWDPLEDGYRSYFKSPYFEKDGIYGIVSVPLSDNNTVNMTWMKTSFELIHPMSTGNITGNRLSVTRNPYLIVMEWTEDGILINYKITHIDTNNVTYELKSNDFISAFINNEPEGPESDPININGYSLPLFALFIFGTAAVIMNQNRKRNA